LREFIAAFSLAAPTTLQTAARGEGAVKSAANHQPNKALKVVRYAHWTRGVAARPLALRYAPSENVF